MRQDVCVKETKDCHNFVCGKRRIVVRYIFMHTSCCILAKILNFLPRYCTSIQKTFNGKIWRQQPLKISCPGFVRFRTRTIELPVLTNTWREHHKIFFWFRASCYLRSVPAVRWQSIENIFVQKIEQWTVKVSSSDPSMAAQWVSRA